MENEEIKSQIEALRDGLSNELSAKMDKALAESKENDGKLTEQTLAELKALSDKVNEAEGVTRKEVEELHTELKKIKESKAPEAESKTLMEVFDKKFKEHEVAIKNLQTRDGSRVNIADILDQKAVANMTFSNISGVNPAIDQRAGVTPLPFRRKFIRELLPVGTTSGNQVHYMRETGGEGSVAVQTEGSAKAQTDVDITNESAQVYDVAHWFRASNQMLEDVAGLSSSLANIGVRKLMHQEDTELLGLGTMTPGLTTNAVAAGGFGYNITASSYWDVIHAVSGLLADSDYDANVCMVRPSTLARMLQQKDTQNRPLHDQVRYNVNGDLMFGGIMVIPSTAIPADQGLVGQFDGGSAEIKQRSGINVRFSEFDEDNFQKNLWTVRIEERIALCISLPSAFSYFDFSDTASSLST